jgi:hypothetical protein
MSKHSKKPRSIARKAPVANLVTSGLRGPVPPTLADIRRYTMVLNERALTLASCLETVEAALAAVEDHPDPAGLAIALRWSVRHLMDQAYNLAENIEMSTRVKHGY